MTIFQKGLVLLAVPLASQIVFFGLFAYQAARQVEVQKLSIQTKDVLSRTALVLRHLVDIETGMRGYLLTEIPSFAGPFESAATELVPALQGLATLVADNPSQTDAARRLTEQGTRFLEWCSVNVELTRAGKRSEAVARVRTGKGKQQMDALRQALELFVAIEEGFDDARAEELRQVQTRTFWLLVGGTCVTLLGMGVMALILHRGVRGRLGLLIDNVSRLEKGLELNPPHTGKDEVAQVDGAFQQMARTIQDAAARERAYTDGLEQTVAQRTQELVQSNEELRLKERRYRCLVAATSQIVWTTDANGQPTDARDWAKFAGKTHEHTLDWGWLELLHPDDRARVASDFKGALTSGGLYSTSFRLRRVDGAWRHMDTRGVPIKDESGCILEWVGVSDDVTEKFEAEAAIRQLNAELEDRVVRRTAQLEAANKELEAFSYSVSHDLRAPLRAMDGFARMLADEFGKNASELANRCLGRIRENAKQLGCLIDDLLSFSRLARQPIKKQTIDFTELCRNAWRDLEGERGDRRIDIVIEEMPDCQGEPALLRQVVVNLLSNAIKFTGSKDPGAIEVGCRNGAEHHGSPVYYVKDDGVGFDMRYANKLFGVFQRLHRADEYKGTGVGLAIVKRIVERHDGKVWVEGELNRGATFFFTLAGGNE